MTPAICQGRGLIAVLHLLSVREDMEIVDIRIMVVLVRLLFFTTCPRPQTAGMFLSVFTSTVGFIRCKQHSRQKRLYSVATSPLVVRTGGTLCCS